MILAVCQVLTRGYQASKIERFINLNWRWIIVDKLKIYMHPRHLRNTDCDSGIIFKDAYHLPQQT